MKWNGRRAWNQKTLPAGSVVLQRDLRIDHISRSGKNSDYRPKKNDGSHYSFIQGLHF